MFEYQGLIDKLSVEEVNSAIKKIVDNYDLTGHYFNKEEKNKYYCFNAAGVFHKFFPISSEFTRLMDKYVQFEYEKHINHVSIFQSKYKIKPENKKDEIYRSLLDYLKSKADIILGNREHLRIPAGNVVVFKDCMLSGKYLDKIEFYKDGGWGIAEEDGTVLIKNHLKRKPSESHSPLCGCAFRNIPYRIIQDRDTELYGVLSISELYETIHCLYDKIEFVDYYEKSDRHFYIKAKKSGKWGCFDEKCALIIDFEYDVIRLEDKFLECIRDANYLLNDSLWERERYYEIKGKRDLYDNEGTLLTGGYDNLFIDYHFLQFYFSTSYEYYEEKETDLQNNSVPISKVRLTFKKSKCLVLDKEFNSIISNGNGLFRMPKWHRFNSLEDVERFVPSECLFRYNVDLSHYYFGFIYLYNNLGEQYFVPEHIQKGFESPEEMNDFYIKHSVPLFLPEAVFDVCEKPKDLFIDDTMVTIIKLNESKEIAWTAYANEVGMAEYTYFIYRKEGKVGFYDECGFYTASFDAITKHSPDGKIYVASFEYPPKTNIYLNNLNYIVHYYRFDEDRNLIPVENNWKIFDPRKCEWLPKDFIEQNYEGYSYDDGDDNFYRGDEWTDEDAWDAMTDGMYGDYPGPGWDPEIFGF
jgi:hypothetical protein